MNHKRRPQSHSLQYVCGLQAVLVQSGLFLAGVTAVVDWASDSGVAGNVILGDVFAKKGHGLR